MNAGTGQTFGGVGLWPFSAFPTARGSTNVISKTGEERAKAGLAPLGSREATMPAVCDVFESGLIIEG